MSEWREYYCHLWRGIVRWWPLKMGVLSVILFIEAFLLAHAPAMAQPPRQPLPQITGDPWTDSVLRVLVWTIGPLDRWLISALVTLVLMDLFFGTLRALFNKMFDRRRFGRTFLKMLGYWGVLTLIWIFRGWEGTGEIYFQVIGWVASRVSEAYLLTFEALSVMENLDGFLREAAGVNLPVFPKLMAWLRRKLDSHAEALLGNELNYRVLIVDDYQPHRVLVRALLNRPGAGNYQPVFATSMATALEELDNGHFDVCLLDLGLPDSKGFDTFMKIREAAPRVPIVVFSGDDTEATIQRCKLAGAKTFLSKDNLSQMVLLQAILDTVETERLQRVIGERVAGLNLGAKLLPETANPSPEVAVPKSMSPQSSGDWFVEEAAEAARLQKDEENRK